MTQQISLPKILKLLWGHITSRRRRQFALVLILTGLASLAEVVSLGAVLPFVTVITQPEKVLSYPMLASLANSMGITTSAELVLPLSIGFALAAIIAGILRLILLWASVHLGMATGSDLSIEIYRRSLFQPYTVHISRSSSEIISGITQKAGTATAVLISFVAVFTSAVLFIAILGTIIIVNPMVAIFSILSFGFAYGIIAWFSRYRLTRNSYTTAEEQNHVIKALQEGLGAIRDVILDGTQKIYVGVYSQSVIKLLRASAENSFIVQFPRYAMESFGLVLIAMFVLILSKSEGNFSDSLPVLAMLALGAQRLLPLMQQLYGNWSTIIGSRGALSDVIDLIEQPLTESSTKELIGPLTLKNTISFKNVSFQYNKNTDLVINNININILKGSRIGIVGTTGVGKSTFLDLLMGLIKPTSGGIYIDEVEIKSDLQQSSWQRSVAHVPQSIFLSDSTIAENIAFGISPKKIDFDRLRKSAEQAQIAEFIQSQPEGYNSVVGERGVRLSGGQRQRIGIARALYKKASVLIFDEATSSLDDETELAVMQTVDLLSSELTMFIVAHRLSTLKNCTHIIKLTENGIKVSRNKESINQND
jgi:ATP-binding cassette, subfamily B, bacterial PglK